MKRGGMAAIALVMLRWAGVGAVCTLLVGMFAGGAHAYEVQVGYADNLRPSPFFPNPWQGGAGVDLFAGAGPSFDAGAIRLINTGGGAIQIQGLTVDSFENAASFTIWGGSLPFTLNSGRSAIFTQTGQFNFDTSDQPIHDLPASSAQPRVTFTVDGVTTSFIDTAQVLNTEGSDTLALHVLNESHQWRDIGTFGGQAPEPATLLLVASGLAVLVWKARRSRRPIDSRL